MSSSFACFGVPVRLLLAGTLAFGLCAAPGGTRAQDAAPPQEGAAEAAAGARTVLRSPVLVIDSERLFSGSGFGQQLADELEVRAAEIAAENRRIEAALAEEERQLTERRAELAPQAFRDLADAFDEKVSRLRRERDQAAQGLGQDSEAIRRQFLSAVEPVLDRLMQDAGAAVILERRSVFVTREAVDITDEAIARIDATLLSGAAEGAAPTEEAPAAPATQEGEATAPTEGAATEATPTPDETEAD